MQSAVTRRAFHYLASKIHPQLPLSPRESQQLLTLLTNSFRAHLDREHPVAPPESGQKEHGQRQSRKNTHHSALSARHDSSQASAVKHIDAILTNPLFATPPRRRGSDPSKADAQGALRDPLGWFLDQVAIGAADIPKAAVCLDILERSSTETSQTPSARPGTRIAEWLWSSGLEDSKTFVEYPFYQLIDKLVPLLVAEGEETAVWRWISAKYAQQIQGHGPSVAQVLAFQGHVLKLMISCKMHDIELAIATFQQAMKPSLTASHATCSRRCQPAGAILVDHILAHPQQPVPTEVYEAFQVSVKNWAGSYARLIQSLLWLHHPNKPSAGPGLNFLNDPEGASKRIYQAKPRRRHYIIQLCLGVAKQMLEQKSFKNAQIVLEFAKNNFPELVSETEDSVEGTHGSASSESKPSWKQQREQENLQLLDSLLPG
ncbi:hypothetical protein CC78DRAFT_265472 [Lojkania enalia]|uniref:Uncharacterized protein n=1 Tax=Lojkania enalia TaxID=147567 RepID=A0A9P4K9H4_9PLEO|nr:hypothetical protein CC78DRAFT_265472 [Didymosphaeria enalia]